MPKYDIPLSKFKYFTKKEKKVSFYNINQNKKTRLHYKRYFAELNSFSFLRFLLMTRTVRPDGKFILIWEIFRSICAALSTVTYMHVRFICGHTRSFEYYFLWFLDLACYVDIYIRLHIGYYNKKGLLIQHPLYTARNYIYGPFLIDFIACVPFRLMAFLEYKITSIIMCHTLKVLQLYRFFMLIYIKAKSIKAKIFFFVIPTCALIVNFIADAAILVLCHIDACSNWPKNLQCIKLSPVSQKLVDEGNLYLYSVYVVASIMTTTGLQGVHYLHQYIFFWFLSIVSVLMNAAFTGLIVSILYSYDRIFLKYQYLIASLRTFMNKEKIPRNLQGVVLDYYQRCWDIRKGQNMNYVMKPFTYSLKREVMHELFGKKILDNWVLEADDSNLFIKRILLQMNQLLLLPGHDILQVNDVCCHVYIIIDGSIIVIDKDKTIKTKLTKGSMFGNLTNAKSSKIIYSFKASNVLEILYIESNNFINYMKRFPNCYAKFQLCRKDKGEMDYLAAKGAEVIPKSNELMGVTSHSVKRLLNRILYICMYFCILGAIVHTMLFFYEVTVRYTSWHYHVYMYGFDLQYAFLFLILYLLKKNDWFRVKYGVLDKYHKYLIILFILSLLPYEFVCFYFKQSSNIFYIFISLKALRFVRIMHIFYIHKTYLLRFCQQMALIRTITMILLYLLMIVCCTAILSLLFQVFQPNFDPEINLNMLNAFDGYQKVTYFVRLVGYIANFVLKITNMEHQPISYIHTIVMIIMMVAIRLAIIIGIGEMSWIIYDMNITRMVYKNKVTNLFSFLKRWDCSPMVMERVQNYLEDSWYTNQEEGSPLLYTIAPRFLKRSMAEHCYLPYIKNHQIFGKCPHDFQRQLVLQLKTEIHEHGQFILLAETHNSKMYWVHRGHVLQILENEDNILSRGDCFAYQEGSREVNNIECVASYKALTQVEIVSLERRSWADLLTHFPEAAEIIRNSHHGSTADLIQKMYY